MNTITLLIDNSSELFDVILKNNVSEKIAFNKLNNKEYTFSSEQKDFLNLKTSEILTEYVLINYEYSLIKNIIFSDYFYLSLQEKNNILEKSYNLITTNENEFLKMLIVLKRRFLIKQSILSTLNDTSILNVKGFINFRLVEYKKMLSELVEKVIKDYRIQKEYKEFIAMLKFFVDTQEKRYNKLHIIFEENGKYTILDEFNKNITEECFEEFNETKEQNHLTNEDLLISALITLAPKKVAIHFNTENYNQKILKTINQIFENKVLIDENMPILELVR